MATARYMLKRIGQSILVLYIAVSITFILYRLMPFGPYEMIKIRFQQTMAESGQSLTSQQLQQLNQMVQVYTGINPEQPLWKEYLNYMWNIIVEQDFGRSIWLNRPVFAILFERLPWSMFISIYGLALGTSISLLFGAFMAHTEGSRFDIGMSIFSIINTTVPYYIVAIILLIIFAFNLGWFPTGGRYDPNTTPGVNLPYMIGVIEHATLPIAASFIAGFGGALAYRGNCIREKGAEYMRVGRLRGISEARLAIRYVGRNALLPVYTGLVIGIAALFSSGIILETVFNYQAVGLVTFKALQNRDYPLLMGAFVFYTGITVMAILLADLTYGFIDPRVRGGGDRETY